MIRLEGGGGGGGGRGVVEEFLGSEDLLSSKFSDNDLPICHHY